MRMMILFLILLILIGCTAELKKADNSQLPNPASVYCEEKNGTPEIITAADGSQSGICTLKNGTKCDEWAYYRNECPVKAEEKTNNETKKTEEMIKIKTIPENIENNCIGFVIGAPDEIALISKIGGAWARPHPGPFAWGFIETEKNKFDFSMTDEYVKKAQENNVSILATVWPFADWDQKQCHDNNCEVTSQDTFYPREKIGWKEGIPKSRCAPCNTNDYKAFIAKLAERYDGDGIDDMPGLIIPIKYYEILNEPEMKESFLTFYKGTEKEYVDLLKASYETIKANCNDCKIVQGGAAGIDFAMLGYWNKIYDLGGASYYDISNIHYIKHGDLNNLNVKTFKDAMKNKNVEKPVWVTEAQYNQESEILTSADGAIREGAVKIFFTQFKVGQFGMPEGNKYSEGYKNIAAKCSR